MLLGTSKHVRFLLNENTNTAAAPLFILAGTFLIVRAFTSQGSALRERAALASGLVLGLGIQMHMNVSQLMVGAVILSVLASKLRLTPPTPRMVALWTLGVLILQAPFLIWLLSGKMGLHAMPGSWAAAGGSEAAVSRVLMAFLGPFRNQFGSFQPLGGLLEFQFLGLAALTALLVITPLAWRAVRPPMPSSDALRALGVLLAVSAFLTIPILLGQDRFRVRYALVFELLLPLYVSAWGAQLLSRQRTVRTQMWVLLALVPMLVGSQLGLAGSWQVERSGLVLGSFALAGALLMIRLWEERATLAFLILVLALQIGIKPELGRLMPPGTELYLTALQTEAIASEVQRNTGWDLERFRESLVQYRVDTYLDWSLVYKTLPRHQVRSSPEWDGIVVAEASAWKEGSPRIWPSSVQFKDPRPFSGAVLVPYLGRRFQNVGHPYSAPAEIDLLRGRPPGDAAIELSDGRILFSFIPCDWSDVCGVGVLINPRRDRLDVRMFGAPLAQPVREVSPGWLETWEGVRLQVKCDGKGGSQHSIAARVGYWPIPLRPHASPEDSVMTPIDFHVGNICAAGKAWSEIAIERDSAIRYRGQSVERLPPLRLAARRRTSEAALQSSAPGSASSR